MLNFGAHHYRIWIARLCLFFVCRSHFLTAIMTSYEKTTKYTMYLMKELSKVFVYFFVSSERWFLFFVCNRSESLCINKILVCRKKDINFLHCLYKRTLLLWCFLALYVDTNLDYIFCFRNIRRVTLSRDYSRLKIPFFTRFYLTIGG